MGIEETEDIKELLKARVEFSKKLSPIIRDTDNAFYNSQYATKDAILTAINPILADCGLCIMQGQEDVRSGQNGINVLDIFTILYHAESAQSVKTVFSIPYQNGKNLAHSYAGALTYGSRYALINLLGIPCSEDDDGNSLVGDQNSKSHVTFPGDIPSTSKSTPQPKTITKKKSAYQAKKDGDWDIWLKKIAELKTQNECDDFFVENQGQLEALPGGWLNHLASELQRHKESLV